MVSVKRSEANHNMFIMNLNGHSETIGREEMRVLAEEMTREYDRPLPKAIWLFSEMDQSWHGPYKNISVGTNHRAIDTPDIGKMGLTGPVTRIKVQPDRPTT